jgi:hypothetical protein
MVLDTVSRGTLARIVANQSRFEGRLLEVSVDSVRLRGTTGDTAIARARIDTLWLRGSQSYDGTKAGAGAGLFLALLFLVAGHRGAQPESSWYGTRFAAYVAAGAIGLGILLDIATPAPWIAVGMQ